MINQTILVALLLFSMGQCSNSVVASQLPEAEGTSTKLIAFLQTDEELRNYSKNGYTSNFTGEFRSIPQDLLVELRADLPEYTFHIARMAVLIDPPQEKYDLMLISNSQTEEVCGFIWGHYWMIPPSKSFGMLLNGYQAKSKDAGLNKIRSLAKLIAYTSNGGVGRATAQAGRLKVQLLRGDGVFRILEVRIDKHLRLGRLSFTAPNGKTPRTFV